MAHLGTGKHMSDHFSYLLTSKLAEDFERSENPKIVAVGAVDEWRKSFGQPTSYQHLHFADFSGLSAEILDVLKPELVVSPVVTPTFDCIDIGAALTRCDFQGSYRALSTNLPNPAIIRREVRSFFPRLDFDICEISDDAFHLLTDRKTRRN